MAVLSGTYIQDSDKSYEKLKQLVVGDIFWINVKKLLISFSNITKRYKFKQSFEKIFYRDKTNYLRQVNIDSANLLKKMAGKRVTL